MASTKELEELQQQALQTYPLTPEEDFIVNQSGDKKMAAAVLNSKVLAGTERFQGDFDKAWEFIESGKGYEGIRMSMNDLLDQNYYRPEPPEQELLERRDYYDVGTSMFRHDSVLSENVEPLFGEAALDEEAIPNDGVNSKEELGRRGALVAFSQGVTPDTFEQDVQAGIVQVGEKGDGDVRNLVDQQILQKRMEDIQMLINNQNTNEELFQQSLDLLHQTQTDQDKYRLEQLAVDNALAFAERNPGFKDLRLLNPGLMHTIAKQQKADQIIETLLAQKGITEKGKGFFGWFVDGLGEIALELVGDTAVSFLRTYGLTPSSLFESAEAIRNLDPQDIPAAFEAFHEELKRRSSMVGVTQRRALSNLEIAFGGTVDDISAETAWAALDAALLLPFATIVKGGTGLLKATGNSSQAAKEIVKATERGTVDGSLLSSSEELVTESTIFRPQAPDYAGLPSAVTDELLINERAINELKDAAELRRLTPEELDGAIKARVKHLKGMYGHERVNAGSVNWSQDKGVFELDVFIGKRDGAGFASKGSAEGWLKKSSIGGEVVETPNGWMIKQTQHVSESLADEGFTNWKPINIARRILGGPKSFVDRLLGSHGTAASHLDTRASSVIKDIYRKDIESLSKKEFNEVNQILNDTLKADTRQWLTPQALRQQFLKTFGKEATDKQLQAYNSYQQISDYAYYLDNRSIFKEKALKGLEQVSIANLGGVPFEGKIITNMKEVTKIPGKERVYIESSGTIDRVTAEQLEEAFNNGYILIRPNETQWTIDTFGEGASYLLVKKSKNVKISALDYHQLAYVPGGRRNYRAPFFIGQQRSGQFADGTRYREKPKMYRTANTEKEALKWVDDANYANRILVSVQDEGADLATASMQIEARTGKTYHEWKEIADEEGWNIYEAFQFKRDRQDFAPDYENIDALRMYDPDSFASQFGVERSSRLGERGSWLKDVSGEDAEVLDALSSLRTNVDQAINAGMYSDFKSSAINRFNTTFRKYITNAQHLSPLEVVTKGEVDTALLSQGVVDGVDMAQVYNAVKAHQFYIKSMLRMKGSWDVAVEGAMNKLARWVDKGETGHKVSAALSRTKGDPISFMRNLNFDLNMSIFNPAQFLMQANSVLIAGAMSPKYGFAAFKDAVPLRMALISGDEVTTRGIGKAFHGLTEGTDIEQAANQFRRLGFNDFGNNLAMMDTQGSLGATSNRAMSKVNRFRESSRFFFQEGERYSRMTAYGIARRKYADNFPSSNPYSKEADNWIREETDRLLLSPNSDNNALLHKGIGALPTQFWSYMMKVSDATFTGAGGRYSARERAGIVAAQVLFYGTAGVPFLDYAVNQFETTTGTVMDPVAAKAIHNGLIDTLIYTATGGEVNTDFSGISGLGGWWSSIIEDLTENPIPELLGGATGSNLSTAWKAMSHTANIYGMYQNPNMEAVTMTALAGVGSMVKSLDKATRAYMAYNTGIWYDRYGRAIAEVSSGEAIASFFGLPPQEVSDTYEGSKMLKDAHTKYIKDVTPILQGMHIRYMNAETDREREEIAELINAFSAVVHQTGYWDEVSKSLMNYAKNPTFQSQVRQSMGQMYNAEQAGANARLLSKEFVEQTLEEKNK